MAKLPGVFSSTMASVRDEGADFVWQNTPTRDARHLRARARVYSHLPNGSMLDDKWALALLQRRMRCDMLETHCLPGRDAFLAWADRRYSGSDNATGDDDDMWVLKDAQANGAGGIWVISRSNWRRVGEQLHARHRYVAQRYAGSRNAPPLVLWNGRKCHVRVYALLTSEGDMYLHQRAFLHVANKPFSWACPAAGDFDDSVHITNCCANSDDKSAFAGEICVHLPSEYPKGWDCMRTVMGELARAAAPFVGLGGADGSVGFEYLGCDFVIDEAGGAWLLEVNCPPSQDTATGLPHAEALHDAVLGELLALVVVPALQRTAPTPGAPASAAAPPAGSWERCGTSNAVGESPALAQLRWKMYSRWCLMGDADTAKGGDRGAAPSAAEIAAFARGQFAFFDASASSDSVAGAEPLCGREWAYFENGGSSQVPRCVVTAAARALSCRWRDQLGSQAKARARHALKTLLGVTPCVSQEAAAGELVFGASASTLLRSLATSYAARLRPGDEIIVCEASHEAHIAPWLWAAEHSGATVRWWRIEAGASGDGATVTIDGLRAVLSPCTRVVAATHVSNVLGSVIDVAAAARTAKEAAANCDVVVDGVALVPHRCAELGLIGCDWYVMACQKCYGPHLGAMWGSHAALVRAAPSTPGHAWVDPDAVGASRWELGTVSAEACAGAASVAEYFASLATVTDALESNGDVSLDTVRAAYERMSVAEAPLTARLLSWLTKQAPMVRVIGTSSTDEDSGRLPMISIVHARVASHAIVAACRDDRVVCRHGSFLSPRILRALGIDETDGVVRFSLLHYNTMAEVEALIVSLERIDGWGTRA